MNGGVALLCKSTVRFRRLTPGLLRILAVLGDLDRMSGKPSDWPDDLVITSINDSAHMKGSRHYTDEAIDLRVKTFPNDAEIERCRHMLQSMLGNQFAVLYEAAGTPQAHLHVQVKKGHRYQPEGVVT